MPSNPNNTTPVLTPGGNLAPSQQTNPPGAVPYIENGLTYQSNNPDFVERDDNGNIIVNQGVTDNQNLVLEATSLRYVNASVIRNIDTRFKYFRFPAENVAVPEISFEGFGIDDLVDLEYAKYGLLTDFIPKKDPSSSYRRIKMDAYLGGQPQSNLYTYTVLPEVKLEGIDLRMRIQLNHTYNTNILNLAGSDVTADDGDTPAQTTITKVDYVDLPDNIKNVITSTEWDGDIGSGFVAFTYALKQKELNPSINVGPEAERVLAGSSGTISPNDAAEIISQVVPLYNEALLGESGTIYFSIMKLDFAGNLTRNFIELFPQPGTNQDGRVVNGQDIITSYDIVIPNEDFQANDQFYIGALVGQDTNSIIKEFHTILSDNTYWSITDASKNVDENNNEIE